MYTITFRFHKVSEYEDCMTLIAKEGGFIELI